MQKLLVDGGIRTFLSVSEGFSQRCLTCQIGRDRSLPWSGDFFAQVDGYRLYIKFCSLDQTYFKHFFH